MTETTSDSSAVELINPVREEWEAVHVAAVSNALPCRVATWAGFGKTFTLPLDLGGERALGVWVQGDGQGAVLNFQLKCPSHVVAGVGEHDVNVDFKLWVNNLPPQSTSTLQILPVRALPLQKVTIRNPRVTVMRAGIRALRSPCFQPAHPYRNKPARRVAEL